MFLKSHSLVVDIGSDALKFVHVEYIGRKSRVLKLGFVSLAQERLETQDDFSSTIAAKINEFTQTEQIKTKNLAFTFSGQSIFSRFVQLPMVGKAKIYQIVRYEAQQQVPFPLEEVIWDYQMIDGLSSDQLCVLIVAIKKEIIESLLKAVMGYGFEIDIVNINALSVYNAFVHSLLSSTEPVAVIDIGKKTTDLVLVEGKSLWTRSIPIAGEAFTQEIRKELKMHFPEAETVKTITLGLEESSLSVEDRLKAQNAIQAVGNRLLAEISRSLGFYRTQFKKNEIKNFYITGGTSYLLGLKDLFSSRLKNEVQNFNPLESISLPEVATRQFSDKARFFTSALGMVFSQQSHALKSNLLLASYQRTRAVVKKQPMIIMSGVVMLLIVLSSWAFNYYSYRAKLGILNHIEKQIDHIDGFNANINEATLQINLFNSKLQSVDQLVLHRRFWLDVLACVEKSIPINTRITKFSSTVINVTTGNVTTPTLVLTIEGVTSGVYADISNFRDALSNQPILKNVEIKSANPPVEGLREFALTMYVVNGEKL